MKIQEMFRDDINRKINGVVKVDQDDTRALVQELDEYVITRELKKHFISFFRAFDDALKEPTADIGVWISGFFGSGKSHFLKILSYLLENKTVDGVKTVERFRKKFDDDPTTFMMVDEATRGQNDTILFNIDIEGSMYKDATAVLRVFERVFYNYLGFDGANLKVANLEQYIDEQGKTEEFRRVFEEKNGKKWVDQRKGFNFLQDSVVPTLVEVLGMSQDAAENWFKSSDKVDISIADFVEDVKNYVSKKPDDFRLLFMVDEVGQYIGSNTDYLLNLQSLIEKLGSECGGKVWVVCTGQEALDEIIKTRQDEFSRIQARFKTRLSLSSSSADEVIQKRILAKTEPARKRLEEVYDQNDSVLRNLLKFNKDDALLDIRGFESADEFARDFPFVPYQFMLMQKVFTEIRKHGNAGKHLSGGERSMLSGFQEAAQKIEEKDEYTLAPFYLFYDTVHSFLDGAIRRVIERCQKAADEGLGIEQQDVNVLKLLYLIRYLDNDIKSTLDTIVILMADNINLDKIQMRAQVTESLNRLLSQNYIGRTGNTYNFLTDEEQDVAREIRETTVDTAQITQRIGQLVFDEIYSRRKFRYEIYDFPIDKYVDGTAVGAVTGGMKLEIYSIATDDYDKQPARLAADSQGQAIVVLGDSRYYESIEQAMKIRRYINTRNVGQLPKSVQDIIRNQQDEAARYESEAVDDIQKAIEDADFYVAGQKIDVKGSDASKKLDQALEYLVNIVYSKLDMVDHNVKSDEDIEEILTGKVISMDGLTPNERAADELFSYLELQDQQHLPTSMADVQSKFQKDPYGWREIDIAAVTALLIQQQRATIKYSGKTIQSSDPKLPEMLRKKSEIGRTMISMRHAVAASQLKEARSFLRDYFDVMDVPEDEDGLIRFITDTFGQLLDHYEGLNRRYDGHNYPDHKVVLDAVQTVKSLLSKASDNFTLIEAVVKKEDALYNIQDSMKDVDAFFRTQVSVFDNAVRFIGSMKEDLYYIRQDEEAEHALNEMRRITNVPLDGKFDYGQIPQLNDLKAVVEKYHGALLEDKRRELIEDVIQPCMAAIHRYVDHHNAEIQRISDQADEFYAREKREITEKYSLALLNGLKEPLQDYRDRKVKKIEALLNGEDPVDPKQKKIMKVTRQQLLQEKTLSTDAEIDEYLEQVGKQMKEYLKGSDGIKIV